MLRNLFGRLLGGKNPGSADRRAFERLAVQAEVILDCPDGRRACQLLDVSPGGALVAPPLSMEIGHEAVLHIPGLALETRVRVVRQTTDGTAIGFFSDDVGAIIAGWIRGVAPADSGRSGS